MNINQIQQYAPQIMTIAKKHGISKIYVFGSVARGESTPRSDVDFLVEMHEGASLFGVAGFAMKSNVYWAFQLMSFLNQFCPK